MLCSVFQNRKATKMKNHSPIYNELDLHHLKIFNTVAKYESYTRAATHLHLSQPALSMQVKKLEDTLDLKLFDKIGNKIVLNTNGQKLYHYTQQIFELITQAEHEFHSINGFIGGELFIGGSNTPGTYIMPKLIGQFKQLYPHVKVNLHISNTDEIATLVETGKLDFAVNGGDIDYGKNIQSSFLMNDELIIVASPQNPICQKDFVEPLDFIHQELIVHETNSQLYKKVYEFATHMGIENRISYILGNISSIKQAIEANMGISLIPKSAAALELKLGMICELKQKNSSYVYMYSLISNKNKYISPAGKLLMELIQSSFDPHNEKKKEVL